MVWWIRCLRHRMSVILRDFSKFSCFWKPPELPKSKSRNLFSWFLIQKLFWFSSLHFVISIAFKVAIFAKDALRREPYPTLKKVSDWYWLIAHLANEKPSFSHQFESIPNTFGAGWYLHLASSTCRGTRYNWYLKLK